ncbi:uncharacterized protein BKCO1_25000123 [Diplodia corticola]|uniref:Integral membrane protein n=1 Tax=Diplodia corticola TaxID=236234 RepID=A0A1J9R0H5_9PEZI|nr:uncharacterized protein BKCO1_25000123 [Diplodia corticola]OJD34097.1 integral membrane protein [Diplodia corticola]
MSSRSAICRSPSLEKISDDKTASAKPITADMDLENTPAMAAPSGETSNLDPAMTSVQRDFIIISSGVAAGATVTVALRVWTRAVVVKHIGLDDYAVVAAWLMGIGFIVCCIQWMEYGFGDHLWNTSLAQVVKYAEWSIPVVTTYCWAPMLSKFSILLTYRHVNPDKLFRIAIYVLMVIIMAYTLATTFVTSAGCKPTDPTKADCIATLAVAQAISNIVTDAIIPIPMIYKLHLPVGQRVVLGVVLAGGSFVIIASIVRLVIIQRLPGKPDFTYEQAKVCNWSSIEIMIGIMCQCIVTLKPLAKKIAPKLIGYSSDRSGTSIWNMFFSSRGRSRGTRGRSRGDSIPLGSVEGGVTVSKASRAREVKSDTEWPRATNDDDIVITSTYSVQSAYGVRTGSTESTDSIMGKGENRSRGRGTVEMV